MLVFLYSLFFHLHSHGTNLYIFLCLLHFLLLQIFLCLFFRMFCIPFDLFLHISKTLIQRLSSTFQQFLLNTLLSLQQIPFHLVQCQKLLDVYKRQILKVALLKVTFQQKTFLKAKISAQLIHCHGFIGSHLGLLERSLLKRFIVRIQFKLKQIKFHNLQNFSSKTQKKKFSGTTWKICSNILKIQLYL